MEQWVFTDYELKHPEQCKSEDIFVVDISESILEEEGFGEDMAEVQVYRNGTVTNRFGDGTVGVPRKVMDLAEDEETLYAAFDNSYDEAYTWRNVEVDAEGNFISFVEDKIPGINAKKAWRPALKPRPIKTKKAGYNGYSNYQTWAVSLWIGNDESLYYQFSNFEGSRYDLADEMKGFFTENNPLESQSSLYADLLNSALAEVNWDEVAENLMEE